MARATPKYQLSPQQQKLASDNLNLARREAWKIQRTTGIEYSVLEGVAFEGLCKASYRYNPESGFKFSSLATPTIRGELLHWVRDRTYALRLSHKMRERWVKGRRLLYRGYSDIQIAQELEISLDDWKETRSACSGPPLELKDQAVPTEALEPEEIDFAIAYKEQAAELICRLQDNEKNAIMLYLEGTSSRPPIKHMNRLLHDAGCSIVECHEASGPEGQQALF
jgi:RNA polymerase sigma-B factor